MIVKVCGMREPDNIRAVTELAVDWLGFIFYPKSKRFVGKSDLQKQLQNGALTEGKKRVGVFVNAEIDFILNAVHDYELDFVQLHGDESPQYCSILQDLWAASSVRSAELIKAFSVDEQFDFSLTENFAPFCAYFIFDTKGEGYGGTGKKFAWDMLTEYKGETPFLLSGGIGPDDVEAVNAFKHPQLAGLDLNSRFETAPAEKDSTQLSNFLDALGKN